jgi:calcium-dependent protein kinase
MGCSCVERQELSNITLEVNDKSKSTSLTPQPLSRNVYIKDSIIVAPTNNSSNEESRLKRKDTDCIRLSYDKFIFELKESPFLKYQILHHINESKKGNVLLIRDKEANYLKVMKEIMLSKSVRIEDVKQEIEALKKLDHPNIIKLYEYIYWNDKSYLITEYCEHSELLEEIKVKKKDFNESKIAAIIYQLLSALSFCHSQKVIHRDIRIKNILIDGVDKNGFYKIKLIDFGLSRFIQDEPTNNLESGFNTKNYYISPEMILGKYNEKCDVWSTGIILYFLLFDTYPFNGTNKTDLFNSIINKELYLGDIKWKKYSTEAISFLKSLLVKDHNIRVSAQEALKSEWFIKMKILEKTSMSNQHLKVFIDELKCYKPDYKLQQACLAIIVHNLPKTDKVWELERAFKTIDVNGDGKLSKKELYDQLKSNPETWKEFKDMFTMVDTDKSNYITYEEFVSACIDKKSALTDQNLLLAFKLFDSDHNGKISLEEIRQVLLGGELNEESEKVIMDIIKSIDSDEDGLISFDEFSKMMKDLIAINTKNKTI